ncbi:MAG TPA: dTDP-4-dehydrorhamnose reductase [Candidatus Marinimicrobia bacterium]|jgi:dTDP-4-dehydrorhamnose reductase|nr:dTDP-4-dehydrorhamnose reductase [Candidatus Neomarinimicrobiota bacterium]
MKKVLITGAGGQLGSSMELEDFIMITTSRFHNDAVESPTIDADLDITNEYQVKTIIAENDPDIIVHLAAMTNVDGCELNPDQAYEVNVRGTVNLLNHFNGKFVLLSTDYVFDGNEGPYSENDTVNPKNVYGKTKLEAERKVREFSADWLILRTNVVWNIGGKYKASFVDWLVEELDEGNQVRIVTDQWNNPTHTEDLGCVINELLKHDASGLYHYGSAEVLNRYDFARLIANIYNLDENLIKPIMTQELNQLAKRPLRSGLKTNKIERDFAIIPAVLREDIEKIALRVL